MFDLCLGPTQNHLGIEAVRWYTAVQDFYISSTRKSSRKAHGRGGNVAEVKACAGCRAIHHAHLNAKAELSHGMILIDAEPPERRHEKKRYPVVCWRCESRLQIELFFLRPLQLLLGPLPYLPHYFCRNLCCADYIFSATP